MVSESDTLSKQKPCRIPRPANIRSVAVAISYHWIRCSTVAIRLSTIEPDLRLSRTSENTMHLTPHFMHLRSLPKATPAVVLLGGPGAGKGTASRDVCATFAWEHICTGDMLRQCIAEGVPPAPLVQPIVEQGLLVEDDIVLAMVQARIDSIAARTGLVFDGCPRTIRQARILDERLPESGRQITKAILIDIPDERLIERTSVRLTCSNPRCQQSYGKSTQLQEAGRCNTCRSPLHQRIDDKQADVIRQRLQVYRSILEPVIAYYHRTNRLECIRPAAHMRSRQTTDEIIAFLKNNAA